MSDRTAHHRPTFAEQITDPAQWTWERLLGALLFLAGLVLILM